MSSLEICARLLVKTYGDLNALHCKANFVVANRVVFDTILMCIGGEAIVISHCVILEMPMATLCVLALA
jgi:hypothetical protein